MKTLAALGCGAFLKRLRVPKPTPEGHAFFERAVVNDVHGQSRASGHFDVRAREKNRQRKLSLRQPVDSLAEIPRQRQIHFAKEAVDELRAESRMMVKEPHIIAAWARDPDVARDDLSLPLWIEKIPVGFEFGRVQSIHRVGPGPVELPT